jgi:hypothetical protein
MAKCEWCDLHDTSIDHELQTDVEENATGAGNYVASVKFIDRWCIWQIILF